MKIEQNIPLLESILAEWQPVIGDDFTGYKNHVYRMVHFCFTLAHCSSEQREKIIIAAAFHDIGIWTEKTIDYIEPSIPPAMAYLQKTGQESWAEEITLMITEHHKITPYTNPTYPLVEVFRQGDIVDFSLGTVTFGIPRADIKAVKAAFPNAGFHAGLVKKASRWFTKHPLNPAPMFKW